MKSVTKSVSRQYAGNALSRNWMTRPFPVSPHFQLSQVGMSGPTAADSGARMQLERVPLPQKHGKRKHALPGDRQ